MVSSNSMFTPNLIQTFGEIDKIWRSHISLLVGWFNHQLVRE